MQGLGKMGSIILLAWLRIRISLADPVLHLQKKKAILVIYFGSCEHARFLFELGFPVASGCAPA